MRKKNLPALFLCVYLSLLACKELSAQKDSVLSFINSLYAIQKSKPLDTTLFNKHVTSLPSIDLSTGDIPLLHKVAESFNNGTDLDYNLYIRIFIHRSLTRTDVNEAIDYAQIVLPLFEKNTGANRALLKNSFLNQLRLAYRNSDRLGEGFIFYNDLLSRSMSANDTASIVLSYFVLAGFYRAVGLYDAAIYHIKKSIAFSDSSNHPQYNFLSLRFGMYNMGTWLNHTGSLGQYYHLKGDFETSLFYSRLVYSTGLLYPEENASPAYQLKNISVALMELNKLDSAGFYLDSAYNRTEKSNFIVLASILQRRAQLYIKKGDLENAEKVIKECWDLIRKKGIRANTPSDVIAPDYYLAMIRIA